MTAPIETVPLHPIERTILISIVRSEKKGYVDFSELVTLSGLTPDQIRRGVEWRKANHLIDMREDESTSFTLGPEGVTASQEGLPERKLVNLVKDSGNQASISNIAK